MQGVLLQKVAGCHIHVGCGVFYFEAFHDFQFLYGTFCSVVVEDPLDEDVAEL